MIIEKSKNLGEVISNYADPIMASRRRMAEYDLKVAIGVELYQSGMFVVRDSDIDRVYEGIPEDELNKLIAERM